MRRNIIAAAFPLLLGQPVLAQVAQEFDQMNEPNWEGAIAEAFFVDGDPSTPRSAEEVRLDWDALTEDEREQVRRDCAALSVDAGDIGGAASGGIADVDTTVPEAGAGGEGTPEPRPTPDASIPHEDGGAQTSGDPIRDVCALVSDL